MGNFKDEMEMPTLCEHCSKIFDLYAGRRSNKWHLDITICEQCGIEEMQEIEEDDIIEVANHDLSEALFDFKECAWEKISDENKASIIQLANARIDFKKLREEYFKEHVSHKTTDGIPVVCTHPHNLFEWFKAELLKQGLKQ